MQKVVGSNPISRFERLPCKRGSSSQDGARRRSLSSPNPRPNDHLGQPVPGKLRRRGSEPGLCAVYYKKLGTMTLPPHESGPRQRVNAPEGLEQRRPQLPCPPSRVPENRCPYSGYRHGMAGRLMDAPDPGAGDEGVSSCTATG
jgi:hypothetical protein